MRGKLIVLEGTDSSGKTTQYNKLVERLRASGKDVVCYHFPKHEKLFGKVVDDYLNGLFGKKEDLSPEFIAMLFMTDFYNSKLELESFLNSGKHVILSRYYSSTLTYQVALTKEKDKQIIRDWIISVCSLLPKPDLTMVLSVDPKISLQLLNNANNAESYKKGLIKDQHESDSNFQISAFNEYEKNISELGWKKIDCVVNNSLLSINEIHEKVHALVKKELML